LESAWDKIDVASGQDRALLAISKDIKMELGGFNKKVDESSQLTMEDHRTYDFFLAFYWLI